MAVKCLKQSGWAFWRTFSNLYMFQHPSLAHLQSNLYEEKRHLEVEIMEDLAPSSSERWSILYLKALFLQLWNNLRKCNALYVWSANLNNNLSLIYLGGWDWWKGWWPQWAIGIFSAVDEMGEVTLRWDRSVTESLPSSVLASLFVF